MTGSTSRLRFTVAEFHRKIEDHGITTTWYKSLPCPCIDPKDGWASPACSLCGGEGIYYYDETSIYAVFQSLNRQRILKEGGIISDVLIDATFKSDAYVSDGDRFIPSQEIVVEKQVLVKGETRPGGGTNERCFYRYPQELELVIDQNGVSYTIGDREDVELVNDAAGYTRNISWVDGGNAPADGVRYSIRYTALAEYRVFLTQPRIRVEGDVKQVSWCRLHRITAFMGDS